MPRKKPTAAKLRRMCIDLAKQIAKTRDRYTCQKCGKSAEHDKTKIDGSHVIAVGICGGRLACDPLNIKALCGWPCHRIWWSGSPVESGLWFAENWPDRWEYLQTQLVLHRNEAGTIPIGWWRERLEELKEELKEELERVKQ